MATRGINKVMLIGHLGQEPEVRQMAQGGAVTTISLATSESWRDRQTVTVHQPPVDSQI